MFVKNPSHHYSPELSAHLSKHFEPFDAALMKLIYELPAFWSSPWDQFTAVEQKALMRLVIAGLAEFKFDLQVTFPFLGWWTRTRRFVYSVEGRDCLEAVQADILKRLKLTKNGKSTCGTEWQLGAKVWEFRLTAEGADARHDLRSGDRDKIAFVMHWSRRMASATKFCQFPFEDVSEESTSSSPAAVAFASATATVGDVNVSAPVAVHVAGPTVHVHPQINLDPAAMRQMFQEAESRADQTAKVIDDDGDDDEEDAGSIEIAIEEAVVPLTTNQAKLVRFLWNRKYPVCFDTAWSDAGVWDTAKDVSDDAIEQAAKRTRDRWVKQGGKLIHLSLVISMSARTLHLTRPGKD